MLTVCEVAADTAVMRALLGFGLSFAAAVAQSVPAAPAGEIDTAWTAQEAMAAAWAQGLAAAWSAGEPPGNPLLGRRHQFDGYDLWLARREPELGWLFASETGHARDFDPGQVLCYLVPKEPSAGRRLLCVRGDGVVAFSDNSVGTRGDGRPLLADDVLGQGGKGTLSDFPRTPGRGRDGNFWLPAEQLPKAVLRLRVVDERGEPLGAVGIATVIGDSGLDQALPAGSCRTRLEGDAVLQGPPARGLRFVYEEDGHTLPLPVGAVVIDGSSTRITVSRELRRAFQARRNESAAIATLKNISAAQAQCEASGAIDMNGNGRGEYGTFAELTGRDVVRGGKFALSPPVLSAVFQRVERGAVQRNGYCFCVFLPGKDGALVAELAGGGPDVAAIDAARAETGWCVYAWPIEAGVTGQRVFVIDQSGNLRGTANADNRYSGLDQRPAGDALLADGQAWILFS